MVKEIIYCLIFFLPSCLKIPILRLLGAKIGRHVDIGIFSYVKAGQIEMADFSIIKAFSLIRCNGVLKMGQYSEISGFVLIYGEAGLHMDKNCYIGPKVVINVARDVRMGSVTAIGPCSVLYTHGSWLPYNEGYPRKFKEIILEDYVWVSASVRILPGIRIGRNSFINTGSVVINNIPQNVFAEGYPAKEVYSMDKIKRPMNPQKLDRLITEMIDEFRREVLEKYFGIDVIEEGDAIRFRYRKKFYLIIFISSGVSGDFSLNSLDYSNNKKYLILNNNSKINISDTGDTFVFNFSKMTTSFSQDFVHRELWTFLRRSYGVKFNYVDY